MRPATQTRFPRCANLESSRGRYVRPRDNPTQWRQQKPAARLSFYPLADVTASCWCCCFAAKCKQLYCTGNGIVWRTKSTTQVGSLFFFFCFFFSLSVVPHLETTYSSMHDGLEIAFAFAFAFGVASLAHRHRLNEHVVVAYDSFVCWHCFDNCDKWG